MNEADFLSLLQKRAKEQKNTMEDIPFPKVFSFVLEWLSVHPLRLIIPLAIIISVSLRYIFGPSFTNFILTLFRLSL